MSGDLYVVAGVDLRQFVAGWLADIRDGSRESIKLLDTVMEDERTTERDLVSFGGRYLISGVAPSCVGEAGTREELLLLGVLITYVEVAPLRQRWEGEEDYLERAFVYMHEVGEGEAARAIRQEVVDAALDDGSSDASQWRMKLLKRSVGDDPAGLAEHERRMASLSQRDLRVADALSPADGTDPWHDLLGG